MAHEGIFATSSEITTKMGRGYDSVNITEAIINDLAAQSESYLNVLTGYNWSDNYAAANGDVKRLLSMASSAICGIWGAMYSVSGYASGREQEDIININWRTFILACKLLADHARVEKMKNAG